MIHFGIKMDVLAVVVRCDVSGDTVLGYYYLRIDAYPF